MASLCALLEAFISPVPPVNYRSTEPNAYAWAAASSSQANTNVRVNNTNENISGNAIMAEGSITSNETAGDGENNLQEPNFNSRTPVDNKYKANSTDPQGNLYIGSSL